MTMDEDLPPQEARKTFKGLANIHIFLRVVSVERRSPTRPVDGRHAIAPGRRPALQLRLRASATGIGN
jgi:hypothetical protein